MRAYVRRRATRVRHGRVLSADRLGTTPNYWNTAQPEIVIDVTRPGRGFRHVVRKHHVERFVELIPKWDQLSLGLDAIVLARGGRLDGWYSSAGVIGICAWQRECALALSSEYVAAHAGVLDRLGVAIEPRGGHALVHFTEGTVRAFLLLHVFLHELGHHVDRMTTRSRRRCARGEGFAEAFAFELEERVRDAYFRGIGLD